MLISSKASVVLVALLLILFSILLPVLSTAQAAHSTPQVPQGLFILKATRIDTTNARLQMLPDPLRPIFSFETATLQNLQILAPATNGQTLISSASGLTFATSVAIKTLTTYEIASALQSFVNKTDLLVLALGGTVSHLSMVNVSLPIDTYLKNGTLSIQGLHISLSSSPMTVPSVPNVSMATVIATLSPFCTATSTPISAIIPRATCTPTASPTVSPSATATCTATPTPTLIDKLLHKAACTATATPTSTTTSTPTITPTTTHGSTPTATPVTVATPTASPSPTAAPSACIQVSRSAVIIGQLLPAGITITNCGGAGTITVSTATDNGKPWLQVKGGSGTVSAGGSQSATISAAPGYLLSHGTVTFTITTSTGTTKSVTVSVTLL